LKGKTPCNNKPWQEPSLVAVERTSHRSHAKTTPIIIIKIIMMMMMMIIIIKITIITIIINTAHYVKTLNSESITIQ
jgi:hypothetical protein